MDGYQDQLGPPTRMRLDDHPVQARRLEGAGGVHAPLQHQMGCLPDQPEVAARNRSGWSLAERDQARQLGIKPCRPSTLGATGHALDPRTASPTSMERSANEATNHCCHDWSRRSRGILALLS